MTKKQLIAVSGVTAFLMVLAGTFVYSWMRPKKLTHYSQPDMGDTMMMIKRVDSSHAGHAIFSIATQGWERDILVDGTDTEKIKLANQLHMLHIQGSSNKYLANYWIWLEPGDSVYAVNNVTGSGVTYHNVVDTAQWCRLVGPPNGIWRNNALIVNGEITVTDDRIDISGSF